MTFKIITRGAPRPVTHDFRCPLHGHFEALVDSEIETVPCPAIDVLPMDAFNPSGRNLLCGRASPWSPTKAPPMRMRRVEATRGKNDEKQHDGWCDTSNLEEGQDFDDWQADRDAVAEELRKELVMEAVRTDR